MGIFAIIILVFGAFATLVVFLHAHDSMHRKELADIARENGFDGDDPSLFGEWAVMCHGSNILSVGTLLYDDKKNLFFLGFPLGDKYLFYTFGIHAIKRHYESSKKNAENESKIIEITVETQLDEIQKIVVSNLADGGESVAKIRTLLGEIAARFRGEGNGSENPFASQGKIKRDSSKAYFHGLKYASIPALITSAIILNLHLGSLEEKSQSEPPQFAQDEAVRENADEEYRSLALSESFDSGWLKDNIEYRLHNPYELVELLLENEAEFDEPKQGEFETKAEFLARQQDHQPLNSILGDSFERENHVFAFSLKADIRYNADKGAYRISVDPSMGVIKEDDSDPSIERFMEVTVCSKQRECVVDYPIDRDEAAALNLSQSAKIIGIARFKKSSSFTGVEDFSRTHFRRTVGGAVPWARTMEACRDFRKYGFTCRFVQTSAHVGLVLNEIYLLNKITGEYMKSWDISTEG